MSGEWVGKQSVLLPRTAPNIVEDQGNSPGIPAQIGRHDTGHKIAGKIIRCLLRHLDSLSSGAKKDELAFVFSSDFQGTGWRAESRIEQVSATESQMALLIS